MKYAIVVDSSCGLTQEQAEKLGYFYLPLHITINNKEYRDGIDVNGANLFDFYDKKSFGKTSAVNMGQANDLLEELSSEYDKVLVYPISKHLSGTCSALTTIAQEYENVRVVQSIQVVQIILLDLVWFQYQMSIDPSKFDEYVDQLENGWFRNTVTLIPKYNDYLVKGGRLHPAAAAVAKLFKIVPMICFEQGQLKKEGVGRSFTKTTLKSVEKKKEILPLKEGKEPLAMVLHSMALENEKSEFINKVVQEFNVNPVVDIIPPVIAIHTGPEALAIVIFELDRVIIDKFVETMDKIKIK